MATALRVAFEKTQKWRKIGELEEGALLIPRNEKLINQLHGLQRTISPMGTVRYSHAEGQHDDDVWSLALCNDS